MIYLGEEKQILMNILYTFCSIITGYINNYEKCLRQLKAKGTLIRKDLKL